MANGTTYHEEKIVCEIVEKSKNIPFLISLFQLAGEMTGQEVEVRVSRDPAIAGGAVLAEAFESYMPEVIGSLHDIKKGLARRDTSQFGESLNQLEQITYNDPYRKAGVALASTIQGATAIFVNVIDPRSFRHELNVFKELARPE